MCEHCGCETFGPIQDLHADHERILQAIDRIDDQLTGGDGSALTREVKALLTLMRTHNGKEEAGIYTMLIENDPRYVASLALEHQLIDNDLRASAHTSEGRARVARAVRRLRDHIFMEEQDTYPYAFQTLSTAQWHFVDDAPVGVSGP